MQPGFDSGPPAGDWSPGLRSDVPSIQPPPDREQWEKDHGRRPRRIATELRFVNQARAAIARDYSTLSRDEAITQDTKLEHICERVKTAEGTAEEHDHVFWDNQDGHFWIYPA